MTWIDSRINRIQRLLRSRQSGTNLVSGIRRRGRSGDESLCDGLDPIASIVQAFRGGSGTITAYIEYYDEWVSYETAETTYASWISPTADFVAAKLDTILRRAMLQVRFPT